MHEITCYHASRFVQNGSFPWIRTTISGSRDRRNAFIRGRNTMPYERMLPYVHMARNLLCPHLMMDECRSGRRIRTAIREYESRVIPNFTTPQVPRPGFEPGAFCSVDRCAIQLRYQGNDHMITCYHDCFSLSSIFFIIQ